MDVNIYKDQMQKAYLFATPVLYSDKPIPREDVPKYWSCYDLRGTDRQPDRPYTLEPEEDEKLGAIGHIRIDFGRGGQEFRHSWWPRGLEELNSPEFKEELGKVVDDLRQSVLKDLSSMRRFCYSHDGKIEGGSCCQNYGYVLETDRYTYRLWCNPTEGDYQAYLSYLDCQRQFEKEKSKSSRVFLMGNPDIWICFS